MKLWNFFDENELLTLKEEQIKERQDNMTIGFWIGVVLMVIMFNVLILV